MRISPGFIFIICFSCNGDPTGAGRNFPKPGELSAIARAHGEISVLEESAIIHLSNGKYISLNYFVRDNEYYATIDGDTFVNPCWIEYSIRFWEDTLGEVIHSGKIYYEDTIAEIVTENHDADSNTFYLLNIDYGPDQVVTVCELLPTQLDSDTEREYVVAYYSDWRNFYYVFDDRLHNFRNHGLVEVTNRGDPFEIDTALKGYFGIVEDNGWGTGYGSESCNYYRLNKDSLAFCFSVNSSYGEYGIPFSGDYFASIQANATPIQVSEGKINVSYEITYSLISVEEDSYPAWQYIYRLSFNYYESQQDSAFAPDAEFAGFSRQIRDECYLDSIVSRELCRLKTTGTARQKYYLKDFDCDFAK